MEKLISNKLASTFTTALDKTTAIRQMTPVHPALNRVRAKVMETSGVQGISAYDRMHHRHNRS